MQRGGNRKRIDRGVQRTLNKTPILYDHRLFSSFLKDMHKNQTLTSVTLQT